MTDQVQIRAATKDLAARIIEASHETYDWHRERHPYAFPGNLCSLAIDPGIVEACAKSSKAKHGGPWIFVAWIGAELAGYIHVNASGNTKGKGMHVGMVADIHVWPAFRRRGVAGALLNHVQALAQERGWDNLEAAVWAGNDASAAAFRAAGFEPQSTVFRAGPRSVARDIVLEKQPFMTLDSLMWLIVGFSAGSVIWAYLNKAISFV